MKLAKILPFLSLGLLLASGCTVKCHFSRLIDAGKGGLLESDCRAKILACADSKQPDCENRMKVECDGEEVYNGRYHFYSNDEKIKYKATDFDDGELELVTRVPEKNDQWVDADLIIDDTESEGSCHYDISYLTAPPVSKVAPKL